MWSLRKLGWKIIAQTGELRFHQRNRWRQTPAFMEQTAALFEWWGYGPDEFSGRRVVDIGAGSRLRSRYFEGAKITAIEPLAQRFIRTIDWCDLEEADETLGIPAEEHISHLDGQAAFVLCINVLDHVFEPSRLVTNAFAYLEPGGEFLLALDLHREGEAGHMHPVHVDRGGVAAMLSAAGFEVGREYDGLGPIGRESFGHGHAYTVISRRPGR